MCRKRIRRAVYYLQRILYGTIKGIYTHNDLVVRTKEKGVIKSHYPKEVFPEYFLLRVNAYDKLPETPLEE